MGLAINHMLYPHPVDVCRYGSIESVRRRSVPVKLDAKMSRKAAVITGNVSDKGGTSHAYVVFQDESAAIAALASNMHMVSLETRIDPAFCKFYRL